MQYDSVKCIALYYKAIPGMLRLFRQERGRLENKYNGIRGVSDDGSSRGSAPGRPAENLGIVAAYFGVGDRLKLIDQKERELERDQAVIQSCINQLNGKYKQVLILRYGYGYSWGSISVQMGAPDSTVRYWHAKAMDRLGEGLDRVDGVEDLLQRASRART